MTTKFDLRLTQEDRQNIEAIARHKAAESPFVTKTDAVKFALSFTVAAITSATAGA